MGCRAFTSAVSNLTVARATMRRREFIAVFGGAVTWPLAARAQPAGAVIINLSENDLEAQRLVTAFQKRLAELGWIDGRNLRIYYRWAGGEVERVIASAKELVKLSADIIVGYATPSVQGTTARDQLHPHCVPLGHGSHRCPGGRGHRIADMPFCTAHVRF